MANPWLHWWSDGVPLLEQPTFPRLLLAMALGSLIGAERQWRHEQQACARILLALRPLSRSIDRKSLARTRSVGVYRLAITSSRAQEQAVSALIMRSLAARPLTLRELRTEETEDSDEILIQAVVESGNRDKALIAKLGNDLKIDPNVTGVEWAETSLEAD